MPNLIESMKQVTLGVLNQQNMVNVLFGTVTKASPLEIQLENRFVLETDELVLTRSVTDFTTQISYTGYETENVDAHNHAINLPAIAVPGYGATSPTPVTSENANEHLHEHNADHLDFTVHNALKEGEKVLLLRVQGGQKFVVWDRIGGIE